MRRWFVLKDQAGQKTGGKCENCAQMACTRVCDLGTAAIKLERPDALDTTLDRYDPVDGPPARAQVARTQQTSRG